MTWQELMTDTGLGTTIILTLGFAAVLVATRERKGQR